MKRLAQRGLLLAAALVLFGVAGVPAHATVTPVSTAVFGTAIDPEFFHERTAIRDNCPLGTLSGSTGATGRNISVSVAFTSSGGVTCTDSLFGASVTFSCRGTVTLFVTSSIAGTLASGTIQFDTGFECRARSTLSSDWSIRGLQSPTDCTFMLSQATQTLSISCFTIAKDGGGEVSWVGTYIVSPRLTVS